jgi:DNA polymerase lambda
MKYMGKSIYTKIEKFLDTGKLSSLEGIISDKKLGIIKAFRNIWGVGDVKANELYTKGYKDIDDLRQRGLHELSDQQLIGLKYYDDLLQRIPRAEVSIVEDIIRNCAQTVRGIGAASVVCITCGSYRRGKPSCGDIDVLIQSFDEKSPLVILIDIVSGLEKCGFLTDHYSRPVHSNADSDVDDFKHASYMGICKPSCSDLFRHVDIKVYTPSEWPYALLYFTGSEYFNRSLRCYAHKLNFSLSDSGICKCTFEGEGSNKKIIKGASIGMHCRSEEDIFALIGVPFKTPAERELSVDVTS